jgi:ABC-2 type transport system ATP-binding protein
LTITIACMAPVLEFDAISKRYKPLLAREDRWALRDFNLHVDEGEIVGFLGPNGAGKTTAIHIALGLALPTSGRGTLLGHNFGHVASRSRIGFLSESPAFYHQSARNTLKFCGALNGVREPELSERTNRLLEAVGLSEDADRSIGKFSRGMLQRIGIAQAFINDPALLILDEPTSALDPLSRLQVRELLLEMRKKGRTIFLSSHQLSEVELICDRVVFVQQGRVIASGRTQDFLESHDEFEIKASGLTAAPESSQNGRREGDRWIFTVHASQQRAAIEQVWLSGGTLISVSPRTRNLEELFVELMRNSAAQNQQSQ